MFDQSKFSPVSSHASDSPAVYTYITGDTLAVVQGVGYFFDKRLQLEKGDVLLVHTSGDVHTKLIVGANTSTAASSATVTAVSYFQDTDTAMHTINTGTPTDIGLEVIIPVGDPNAEDYQVTVGLPSVTGSTGNTDLKMDIDAGGVTIKSITQNIGNTELGVNITSYILRGIIAVTGDVTLKVLMTNASGNVTIDNSSVASLNVVKNKDVEI